MKKILISCFALFLLFSYIHGQAKYDPMAYPKDHAAFIQEQNDDVKNNAEFVFEGFFQRSDNHPYSISVIVKITKVFRGNLKPGTVEVAGVQTFDGLTQSSIPD